MSDDQIFPPAGSLKSVIHLASHRVADIKRIGSLELVDVKLRSDCVVMALDLVKSTYLVTGLDNTVEILGAQAIVFAADLFNFISAGEL